MKKMLLLILIVFTIVSCETRPSIVKHSSNELITTTTLKEYVPNTVDAFISGQSIKLSVHKTGVYMVEAWSPRYRSVDYLWSIGTFNVNKLPFDTVIYFIRNGRNNDNLGLGGVYRVEITYSDGRVMERKTIHF